MPYSRFSQAFSAPKRSSPGSRTAVKASASASIAGEMVRSGARRSRAPRRSAAARRERRGPALAGQQLVEVGQALGLLAIGAEELYHRRRGIGRGLGDLDQFLVARQFAGQQRVGEHFLQRRDRAARLALQFVRIDLVDGGELEDELDRQRPLVALDEVEIGRRDAEPLRHRRLGQALGVADAADARSREDLLFGHRQPWHLPELTRVARFPVSTNFYKFTVTALSKTIQVFPYFCDVFKIGSRILRTAM